MSETKKSVYVETFRQWVRDYQIVMRRAWQIQNDYGLYQNLLAEDDIADDVIASPTDSTKLTAFVEAIANLQSIFATFDAGIDTNLERVA